MIRRLVSTALLCAALSPGLALADEDPRTSIELEPEQRAAVLGEMRQFMEAIDTILASALAEDMAAVTEASRPMGMEAVRRTPASIKQAMPAGFMKMGRKTHLVFEQIAQDAEDLGDPRHTLEQLNRATALCVSCHRTYRFESHAGD